MSELLRSLGYYTEEEVCEIYGVIKPTLRNWRSRRIGPPWAKRGRDVVYPVDGVRQHLQRRTVHPENAA